MMASRWEDPHCVGAPPEFLVQTLLGVARPDLAPHVDREPCEGQQVGPCTVQMGMNLRQRGLHVVQEMVKLGFHSGEGAQVVESRVE